MYVCLRAQAGETLLPRTMTAPPEALLKAIAPSRDQLVLAAACLFTWDWLADLCAEPGMPFVRGHALSMKAIHGGKAQNDKIDAHKLAVLLRGGLLPQASVSPAEMRATRDLLRRRRHLARHRGELLAHVHNTNRQAHLPAIGKKIAYTPNRDGVAERLAAPAVPKSIAGDLARLTYDDARLRDVALTIVTTAKHHDAHTLELWQTGPGIGQSLSLGLLYAIPQIARCPRGQDFAAYCRLGKCAKESAGKRSGTSGTNIGKAHLTGAFSEAAVFFLRENPAGQKCLASLEKKQSKGQAWTILAPQWARAVSDMWQPQTAFDMPTFLHR
jgi:transposase